METDIRRTNNKDDDFLALIALLDEELDAICPVAHKQCAPYNTVDAIIEAVVVSVAGVPAACGAYRKYDETTAELKRVFVRPEYRGRGLARLVVGETERLAAGKGYRRIVLETGTALQTPTGFTEKSGYTVIPNYGSYKNIASSVCMQKSLCR